MNRKKSYNKAIAFLLVILLVLGSAPAAFADGSEGDADQTTGIIYKGKSVADDVRWFFQKIYMDEKPEAQYTATDLFSNPKFKNVMPGDTLEQKFIVKNEAQNNITLFMEVLPHGKNVLPDAENKDNLLSENVAAHITTGQMIEFLSYFSMQVIDSEGNVLFNVPFEEKEKDKWRSDLGTIYEKKELGVLPAGYGAELKVVLHASTDMDNEFDAIVEPLKGDNFKGIGEIDFRFTIQENEPGGGGGGKDPKPPKDPDEEIDDPDVPLDGPDEPTVIPGEPVEDIPDPKVPLGDAPKTGDNTKILPLMLLMIAALAGLVTTRKKLN